ncbi:MAG: hypothetical protein JJU00_10560 [Opitutales bacterium]|nr:hypothetical protein [Opitutales bacterium]
MACLLFMGGVIATVIVGLNAVTTAVFIAAAAALLGPAAADGSGGILEFFAAVVELIVEGFMLIIEAIGSIFSGIG